MVERRFEEPEVGAPKAPLGTIDWLSTGGVQWVGG
jgi:hypothetical protein